MLATQADFRTAMVEYHRAVDALTVEFQKSDWNDTNPIKQKVCSELAVRINRVLEFSDHLSQADYAAFDHLLKVPFRHHECDKGKWLPETIQHYLDYARATGLEFFECAQYESPDLNQMIDFRRRHKDVELFTFVGELFAFLSRRAVHANESASIIVGNEHKWACRKMCWGWMVPGQESPLINGNGEAITELPAFKSKLENRCLIPAGNFKESGVCFFKPGQPAFCIAGLWHEENGRPCFVMLTTAPNDSVAPYHNLMPFLLRDEQLNEWLWGDWKAILANPDKSPLKSLRRILHDNRCVFSDCRAGGIMSSCIQDEFGK